MGGETTDRLGGSAFVRVCDGESNRVPTTDHELLQRCIDGLLEVMERGDVFACHDVSEGGLAVALAEMAIGGNLGVKVDLSQVHSDPYVACFSEANTRWVVEVAPVDLDRVKHRVPVVELGEVTGTKLVLEHDGKEVATVELPEIRKARNTLWEVMG